MFKIRRKKENYQFTDKIHPMQGILSFILSIVLMIAMLLLFVYAGGHQGVLVTGCLGILILMASIAGFSMAVKAIRREDLEIYYKYPILGLLLNGIVMVSCVILYLTGITLTWL